MGRVTDRRRIVRIEGDGRVERVDTLAAEEPLEIRVGGRPVSVTMRTPGDDFDLVAGFLTTEGVTGATADLAALRYCAGATGGGTGGATGDGTNSYNVIDATLADTCRAPAASLERNFYTTSSCGVCGKASIEAIRTITRWPVAADPVRVPPAVLTRLPGALRAGQAVFDKTGGLHAAGIFDSAGSLRCLREDVGRHNAVDKVVGWAAREGLLPLTGCILMVSGRASFELAQKAVMAGIPVLAAVSAPSTLAVDLAEEAGLTLVGFLRGDTMNVYTRADRVAPAS